MPTPNLRTAGFFAAASILVAIPLYFALPLFGSTGRVNENPLAATDCGNGVIEASEQCDDGNALILDGCVGCMVERGYRCTGEPSACLRQFSGDGCGNGIISRSEECDDGNARDGDGCSRICLREEGAQSPASVPPAAATVIAAPLAASVTSPVTKTVILEPDPELISASSSSVTPVPNNPRRGRHSGPTSASVIDVPLAYPVPEKAGCGDGLIIDDEECDDGNARDGDGCGATCAVEHGYQCRDWPSKCELVCGDGVVGPPETCDDRNAVDGDGCSALCREELGYECDGEPSMCEYR